MRLGALVICALIAGCSPSDPPESQISSDANDAGAESPRAPQPDSLRPVAEEPPLVDAAEDEERINVDPAVIAGLIKGITADDPHVRNSSVREAAKYLGRKAETVLVQRLEIERESEIRSEIVRSLIGSDRVVTAEAALQRVKMDESEAVATAACKAMLELPECHAASILSRWSDSDTLPEDGRRFAVTEVCGELNGRAYRRGMEEWKRDAAEDN